MCRHFWCVTFWIKESLWESWRFWVLILGCVCWLLWPWAMETWKGTSLALCCMHMWHENGKRGRNTRREWYRAQQNGLKMIRANYFERSQVRTAFIIKCRNFQQQVLQCSPTSKLDTFRVTVLWNFKHWMNEAHRVCIYRKIGLDDSVQTLVVIEILIFDRCKALLLDERCWCILKNIWYSWIEFVGAKQSVLHVFVGVWSN